MEYKTAFWVLIVIVLIAGTINILNERQSIKSCTMTVLEDGSLPRFSETTTTNLTISGEGNQVDILLVADR